MFIHVFLAGTGKQKVRKQVLVKNYSNKKGYVGMGGVTQKGGVTAYVIAFEPHQNVSYKRNNIGCNSSVLCDPTHSFIQLIFFLFLFQDIYDSKPV